MPHAMIDLCNTMIVTPNATIDMRYTTIDICPATRDMRFATINMSTCATLWLLHPKI